MKIRVECDGCNFHIPASDGCTKVANGLACHYGPIVTEAEEIAFQALSAPLDLRSATDRQVGGAYYKDLGAYQPWLILKASMTPEEFRGYMKGTALVYLLRDGKKGADDLEKGLHTLEGFVELK